MKTSIACFVLLFVPCTVALTQTADSLNIVQDNFMYSQYLDNKEVFLNDYQIDLNETKQGKLLTQTYLLLKPLQASEENAPSIAKGEVVTTFKFFPLENFWAVRYKEYYGFVPNQYIMPIKDKSLSDESFPYDEPPKALNRMKIKYPKDAIDKGVEGTVSLKVLIDRKGAVRETEIVVGIPELNEAAIEAVKNLKFKAARYKGKPVDVWLRIPVSFSIESY